MRQKSIRDGISKYRYSWALTFNPEPSLEATGLTVVGLVLVFRYRRIKVILVV